MADERLGLRERIGGVKERVVRLLLLLLEVVIMVGPADIGGRGEGWAEVLFEALRAVVRIWML